MARQVMSTCAKCGLHLPLCLPRAGEPCMLWICTGCGATYGAVLDCQRVAELLANVRPAKLELNPERLEHLPEAADAFISQLQSQDSYHGRERRERTRHRVVAPVAVMPLGDAFQPSEDAFLATTLDVSRSGLSILSTRAISTQAILVDLLRDHANSLQVIVHPVRCRTHRRFYEIGGPFMTKMVDLGC